MKHAFSLVELSIVLVILGLLTGGILGGQSLIRAAELRATMTDYQSYRTAVMTFRDKYFALPGDMNNATAFWTQASDCTARVESGKATCNGNGDGILRWGAPTVNRPEIHLFWQHLSNAELIAGGYQGIKGPGSNGASSVAGLNVPAVRGFNGCVSANWVGAGGGASGMVSAGWPMNKAGMLNTNIFLFGASPSTPDFCWGGIYKPEEIWNVDTKMDDGKPATGIISTWATTGCVTDATQDSATSTYDFTSTGKCAIYAAFP